MIGKRNIVFGFLFLFCTAALGPYMVLMYQDQEPGSFLDSSSKKQQDVGRLQELRSNEFEEDLEELDAGVIARANTDGVLAINQLKNAEFAIDHIKGGPHAHGNLEALLNIMAGVVLCFIGVAPLLKNIVSWMLIIGTVMHSGMLYLERVFELSWATTLLETGIGPILLLASFVAMGFLTLIGFESRIVHD